MASARVDAKPNISLASSNFSSIFHVSLNKYASQMLPRQIPPQFIEFLTHLSESFLWNWDFGSITFEQSAHLLSGVLGNFPLLRSSSQFDQNPVLFVRFLLSFINNDDTIHALIEKINCFNPFCNNQLREIQETLKTLQDKLQQQQNATSIVNSPSELHAHHLELERVKQFLEQLNIELPQLIAKLTAPDGLVVRWKQSIEISTSLLSLAANAIADSVRDWCEQQRLEANRTETRDDKGQQLAVPKCLELRLNALEQLACVVVQQVYFLLDSLQRLGTSTPDLVEKIPALVNTRALLEPRLTSLLYLLATRTFLMYNHPAQVLKKENRFCASVRWLAGSALRLGPADFNSQCTARLLSHEDTERVLADPSYQVRAGQKSARITQNGLAQMERDEAAEHRCVVHFTQMKYFKARLASRASRLSSPSLPANQWRTLR